MPASGPSRPVELPPRSCQPDSDGLASAVTGRRWRRAFVGLLAVLAALSMLGAFGIRTATVSASGRDGTRVEVFYARVTRPGLTTPYRVEVSRAGGFDRRITVVSSLAYLDLFDANATTPAPVEEASSTGAGGEVVEWTFDPPDGDTLVVSFDARAEPGVHGRRKGRSAVVIDGIEMVAVAYTTWILP